MRMPLPRPLLLALRCGLLCGLLLAPALGHAWGVQELMQDLARHPGGRARFVETKHIALLDAPLVASGDLLYRPPDRLEKRTLKPRPELMRLEGDTLTLEQGKHRFVLQLADRPEALAFVDSIRGTLAGDLRALERSYALDLAGSPASWALRLLPKDPRIAALVLRIDIAGSGRQVRSIKYLQADGDRSEMAIEPLEAR